MILGAEIALLIAGLYMLFTGKGVSKLNGEAPEHWQYRLLGGFCVLLIPAAFLGGVVMAVLWMIWNPDLTEEQFAAETKWPFVGMELGLVILWGIVAFLWERMIKAKVERETVYIEPTGWMP